MTAGKLGARLPHSKKEHPERFRFTRKGEKQIPRCARNDRFQMMREERAGPFGSAQGKRDDTSDERTVASGVRTVGRFEG